MTQDAKKQKADLFSTLIKRKFGYSHGFKSKAATTIGCTPSNLSAMLLGRISIPQKYFEALKRLPDHIDDEDNDGYQNRDMYQSRIAGNGTWYASLALTSEEKQKVDLIAAHLNGGEPIELNFENFSILVAHLIKQFAEDKKLQITTEEDPLS